MPESVSMITEEFVIELCLGCVHPEALSVYGEPVTDTGYKVLNFIKYDTVSI